MSTRFRSFDIGVGLTPQSADPSNPTEGLLFYSDGTPRAEGLWVYTNGAFVAVMSSSSTLAVTTKTANYTVTTADDVIITDATGGTFTLTLPTAVGNTGKMFLIHRKDGTATNVIIDGNSTETIDGDTTLILAGRYTSIQIVSDGSNWYSLSRDMEGTVFIRDIKSSGTAGGDFTSGSYQTRVLNATDGDTWLVSVSSNQFTLQKGDYIIEASAPAFSCDSHKARLRDITNTATSALGTTEYSPSAGSGQDGMSRSHILAKLALTAATTFEIQHQCGSTKTGNGFGVAATFGDNETYTVVKITKIG